MPAACGDPRFYRRTGPHPLADVASVAAGEVAGEADLVLHGIAPLQAAGPQEVSFLDNRRYAAALRATRAGAVIVAPDMRDQVPAGSRAVVTAEPYLGWARVAALFHPVPPPQPGVHPSAVVDKAARIDPSAEIGPLACIGAAEIGPRTRVGAHAAIGDGVAIGADCRIGAHVTIAYALLGDRVCILPGARIGQDGFGFVPTDAGFVDVPQLGRVVIGDDVNIGANTTIDRGSAQDTVIGAGSRLDNLIQIGHNVHLGRCCVIVAQAGISGSTVLEDFVTVAGQAGLIGHLHIGRKARIGAQAGVIGDVAEGADVLGSPSQPVRELWRQMAALRRLVRQPPASAGPG